MSKVVGPLFVVILSAEEKAGECRVPMGWPPAGQSPSVSDGMGVFSAEWVDFGGNRTWEGWLHRHPPRGRYLPWSQLCGRNTMAEPPISEKILLLIDSTLSTKIASLFRLGAFVPIFIYFFLFLLLFSF